MVAKDRANFATRCGAKVMCYSPLARGIKLKDSELLEISDRIGCTPAQLMIKWSIDKGYIPIPKTANKRHLLENFIH